MTDTLIPYMRKSSGEDPEGSRSRQRAAIRRWAEANDVDLAPEVWEPHVSGKKSWRERGLGEALSAVARGEAAGIICEEQNRLSRENMRATAEVWESLDAAQARLVITAEGIDTAQGDHELRFNINAALAREQWKQYARRMADMKVRKLEAGIWIGPVPLGFTKNEDKTLRVDPEKADLVRELFEARASGASIPGLARRLDAVGLTYSNEGVRKLLGNDIYVTGRPEYGGLVGPEIEGGKLVDVPLFHAVQKVRGERPPRSESGRWLLTGLAFCGTCGRNLHPKTDGKGGYRRYFCGNRHCAWGGKSVSARRLEKHVRDLCFAFGDTLTERGLAPSTAPLEEALATAEARLDQVMADGVADELGYLWAPEVGRRRRARDEAAAKLGEARAASPVPDRVRNLREEWDTMTPMERREAIRIYPLERVEVGGLDPASWLVAFS